MSNVFTRAAKLVLCISFLAYSVVPAIGATDGPADQTAGLNEIVVTAQKREERIQDIPIPVSAINTNSLTENNQLNIKDYYTEVPGLSLAPSTNVPGQTLSLRGVTTGGSATTSTVGIMVDDMPFGGTGSLIVPDFDPGDLQRIEVLRGPQGTLYGASSMGGLIKFVTVDPSMEGVSGRVEAGTDTVSNGAELGYTFRGSLNVPVTSDLALRASAFARQDPGYVDNVLTGQRGVNEDHAYGFHLAVLWQPLESLSVKLNGLYQDTKGDGSSIVVQTPGLGNWQQNLVRGAGVSHDISQAYWATLTDKIGSADLTLVSGYNVNAAYTVFDGTSAFGACCTSAIFPGVTGTPSPYYQKYEKFTDELRIAVPLGKNIDSLAGVFFTHEDQQATQAFLGTDPVSGAVAGVGNFGTFPTAYLEYAGFADLTYHFTDRFDIQVGGRFSHIQQTFDIQTFTGPLDAFLYPTSPVYVVPESKSSSSPVTYLVTPSFKISSDWMVYARVATGYRAGGSNGTFPEVPPEFQPDKTKNYEIGTKGDFLDHALSFDLSVYYIDWTNVQIALANPNGTTYTGNAGGAKSQGVEFSLQSIPMSGLRIAAWVVFSDAVLTETFPDSAITGTFGAVGAPLPYSSRFSGNLSVDQDFPLSDQLSAFFGGAASYVGERQDVFTSTAERQHLPAYAKMDLHAGVNYESYKLNVYANNITNRLAIISGGFGNFPADNFNYIAPRTVGVSVSKTF